MSASWLPAFLNELPALDAAALLLLLLQWGGYNLVIDRLTRHPIGLNAHMQTVRIAWMRAMVGREERVIDAILIGHLIHSVSFFASATMLLVAALVGIVAAVNQAYDVVMALSFTAKTTRALFELKLMMLTGVFVYAFFKFTWSLRQYNYCCALVGAADAGQERLAQTTSTLLSLAVTSFNGGLRAYYFAIALLSWLVHPLLFMAASTWMLLVLLRRQFGSRTNDAVRRLIAGKP